MPLLLSSVYSLPDKTTVSSASSSPSASPTPSGICSTGPLLGVVALGEVRGNIELLESRGEARVQLVHPSSCSRVLRQGFNVGHKVLGDVQGPGKRDEALGGLYGWEIRGDESL